MLAYGIGNWTVEDFSKIENGELKAEFSENSKKQIQESRKKVEAIVQNNQTVYGINTGFGPLCDTKVSDADLKKLQHNLLISHAVGVGNYISKELSKKMLICKLHALSRGFSGITLEVAERIHFMIENDLIPCVPEQGSVGASGDLAPLAHLFLPLMGLGFIWEENQAVETSKILQKHNLQPIELQAKEGLALFNGTQFILAHALEGLQKFECLLDMADVFGAMSLEAFQGSPKPFQEELHQIRPFEGTQLVAKRLRKIGRFSKHQLAYRLRKSARSVFFKMYATSAWSSRNAFLHVKQLAEIELNSVTDNPIVISETEAISGGNFHGQPLAMALDYATLAASELGNISDRRQYLLLEGKYGLPRLLTEFGGLNSGFMIPQYTSAALCTENKTLCFPASADSIPTSLGQEDHVSMGSISGRKFNQVLGNVTKILAIELMYACQGVEFRRPLQMSGFLENIHSEVRKFVPKLEEDRLIGKDMEVLIELISQKEFQEKIKL